MTQQIYKRFWCPREGKFSLSDFGFLYSPGSQYGRDLYPDVKTLTEISSIPCLVLLGEAGMGKSTAIEQAYQVAKTSGAKCLRFGLGDYSSDPDLCQAIFKDKILQDWLEGDEYLNLFLDSLDEGLLSINRLTIILKRELDKLPCDRLSLRITCRTADWDFASSLEEKLKEKWNKNVGVYELLPLTRLDIIEASKTNTLDPDEFIKALFDRDAVPLAIKPTTLKFLINTYKKRGDLPLTQKELYYEGCKALCTEINADRIESGNKGKLSESQRMVIAARIAAIFIFANRAAIWTRIALGDEPSSDIAITEICTGVERIDDQDFPIIEDSIRETLSITSLFSSRGVNRLGFAHQTYAEFLAAWYVAEHRKLPLVQIMSLLTTPEDPEKLLVPQLHETAAWIASMRQDVLREVIKTDPDVILRSDIPTDAVIKENIVANLLKKYEQGVVENFDSPISNWKYLTKLKHPNLANQLLVYLQDKSKSLQSRRESIDIAELCEEKSLQDALADLALAPLENIHLRGSAAKALTSIGDSATKAKLKPLAIAEITEGKFSRLKDYSLMAVFPDHLTVEELFLSLKSSETKNYDFGYSKFLSKDLANYLSYVDLPIALSWVLSQGVRQHRQYPFESLVKVIIPLAWEYLEEPIILELVAQIVLIQWKAYEPVITEDLNFEDLLIASEKKKQILIESIVLLVAEERDLHPYYLIDHIRRLNSLSTNFIWLIEKAKSSINADVKTIWINLVQWSFNNQDTSQIDALLMATCEDPIFHERFGAWFKARDFDSDEAKKEQEYYQEIQESARNRENNRRQKFSKEQIKARIGYCLDEFEAGKLDAWWWLNREMTIEPDSSLYENDLNIDITSFYGWKLADSITKQRIFNAGKIYMNNYVDCSYDWIGTNTYNLPSLAGCRVLYLLLKENVISLNQISNSVWKKWTPVILAFPNGTNTREDFSFELVKSAYLSAPEEFVDTLLKLIDAENKQNSYIFIIDKLEKCWDERLKSLLLEKIKALDLQPKCISQLLEELLKQDHEQSRDFAKSLLSPTNDNERHRAIFVAQVLLKQARESDWDQIWDTITKDLSVVQGALEDASYGLRNINLNLNETQLANLYIWTECHYPHTEDPVYDTVHSVESRESVANFRDGVLSQLRETGTLKACQEIQRIIQRFPEHDHLNWHLLKAQNALRKKSWKPPEPSELLQLINDSNKRLIQDGNQLLDVLIEALNSLDKKFSDQTPKVIDLWNEIKWGQIRHLADSLSKYLESASSFSDLFKIDWRKAPKRLREDTYLPKDEERVSDYVVRYLRDYLEDREVILNREVVIRDSERTDILVQVMPKNQSIERHECIEVIIEVKGIWNSGLNVSMQNQLVDRYLKDNTCQNGLYLVAWFNCAQWDDSDTRKKAAPKITLEQARDKFENQAKSLSKGEINLRAFVLNTALRS